MGSYSKWEPTNRPARLKMAEDWLNAFNDQPSGQTELNKERWRISVGMETELTNVVEAIAELERRPMSQRTPDNKKELADAYDALTVVMRDIKKMCFMSPPLIDRDYGLLGLRAPDVTPTPVRRPEAVPLIEHSHKGSMVVEFRVKPEAGGLDDDKADYGLKFKGCIVPKGEPDGHVSPCGITYKLDGEPQHDYELAWDMFTRKKKFDIVFDRVDEEARFYYCARYENSKGEGGPWSTVGHVVVV